MVSALVFVSSCPGLNPGQGHCLCVLGQEPLAMPLSLGGNLAI